MYIYTNTTGTANKRVGMNARGSLTTLPSKTRFTVDSKKHFDFVEKKRRENNQLLL